jgi:hypothetical protein
MPCAKFVVDNAVSAAEVLWSQSGDVTPLLGWQRLFVNTSLGETQNKWSRHLLALWYKPNKYGHGS